MRLEASTLTLPILFIEDFPHLSQSRPGLRFTSSFFIAQSSATSALQDHESCLESTFYYNFANYFGAAQRPDFFSPAGLCL